MTVRPLQRVVRSAAAVFAIGALFASPVLAQEVHLLAQGLGDEEPAAASAVVGVGFGVRFRGVGGHGGLAASG